MIMLRLLVFEMIQFNFYLELYFLAMISLEHILYVKPQIETNKENK